MEILIFKIVLILSSVVIIVALKNATNRAQTKHSCSFDEFNAYKTETPILLWIRGILGIPAYIFLIEWLISVSYFPWAYIKFSIIINWIGLILLLISTFLLYWSLNSIKTNYHGTIGLHKEHELVTTGAYKYIRHPIVVSFLLVHISIFLLTSNWALGILLITTGLAVCILRTPIEEKYLIDRFGSEYVNYIKRIGKYFPKII